MRVKAIYGLWLPLAVSFELMMLEGPTVQGAIGRLPAPALNLAAWNLVMSLSLLIESPVIMLLATAIALAGDGDSYRALRRFMVWLAVGCTAATGVIAFTPLFDSVTRGLMAQPGPIAHAAQPALRIMLLWTAAIAWRRFYQGVLVRHGHTRKVSLGTAVRLASASGVAIALAAGRHLPGVQVAACALMAAVITEALVTTAFALPVVRRDVETVPHAGPPLTQRAIWKFHTPLAATTVMTLLAQPMTSAALARLPGPIVTLAAWPVASMLLLVLRGGALALQEISVAQGMRAEARSALCTFTWLVGGVTTALLALIAFTPLLDVYLLHIIRLPANLTATVRAAVGMSLLLPLATALGSWRRGLLVAMRRTDGVYKGMGLNLATHAGLLCLGVAARLPGMAVAACAMSSAAWVELLYLRGYVTKAITATDALRAIVVANSLQKPDLQPPVDKEEIIMLS